ncbi:hypothetical protein C2S51_018227 [Perilla frutescens var. frutescens]|nr:hypothetical protein C2S51_018227 [Perilla frutescens var. frutescens]
MNSSTDSNNTMGDCSTNRHHQTPRLCGGGCGFFGTAEKRGLCSKCYNHYLQQSTAKFRAELLTTHHDEIPAPPPPINIPTEKETGELCAALSSLTISGTAAASPPATKAVCNSNLCTKKLGLLSFVCRCGGGFCNKHRLPEAHACTFDFKEAGKISIRKQNPLCKSDKIQHRV